jgi:hypothetical protein
MGRVGLDGVAYQKEGDRDADGVDDEEENTDGGVAEMQTVPTRDWGS